MPCNSIRRHKTDTNKTGHQGTLSDFLLLGKSRVHDGTEELFDLQEGHSFFYKVWLLLTQSSFVEIFWLHTGPTEQLCSLTS